MSNNPWITGGLSNPLGLAVSNGKLYVANNFVAPLICEAKTIGQINLNPLTNNPYWSGCLLSTRQYFLATNGDYLYCTDNSNVYQIDISDPNSPSLGWTNSSLTNPYGVVVADNYLYVSGTGDLYKLNLSDGSSVVWVVGGGQGGWGITTDGTNLYVSSETNIIYVYKLSDASPQISVTGPVGDVYINVVYSGGSIYSMDPNSNNITQFNLNSTTNSIFATVYGGVGGYGLAVDETYLYASVLNKMGPLQSAGQVKQTSLNIISRFPLVPNSNICFPAGTPITTDQGIINIDKIDTTFNTINQQPILYVTKTVSLDKYLISLEKNSLGRNLPCKKTIMTTDHKIEFEGQMVPAYRFLDFSREVKKVKYEGEALYNILLADYGRMNVNGLMCETLHPENIIAKLYTSDFDESNRSDIICQMNYALERKDLNKYKDVIKILS